MRQLISYYSQNISANVLNKLSYTEDISKLFHIIFIFVQLEGNKTNIKTTA